MYYVQPFRSLLSFHDRPSHRNVGWTGRICCGDMIATGSVGGYLFRESRLTYRRKRRCLVFCWVPAYEPKEDRVYLRKPYCSFIEREALDLAT